LIQVDTAPWTILQAAVDYWAGTTPDPELGGYVDERARQLIENDNLGVSERTGASEQGYSGVMSDHAFTGGRDDGHYIRLSASRACDDWRWFSSAGMRTSRIDLQVTAVGVGDSSNLARSIFHSRGLLEGREGRPIKMGLYATLDDGDTLYVGSPKSDRRGRLYDKGRESKGAYSLGTWRWEVQSRHGIAEAVAVDLLGSRSPRTWIGDYVATWFSDRGVPIAWDYVDGVQRDTYKREETTDEQKMSYLRASIAPMVATLLLRHSKRELRQVLRLQYDPGERYGDVRSDRKGRE
jgi:hypothetical protein